MSFLSERLRELVNVDNRRAYVTGLILALGYATIPPAEALSLAFKSPFTVQDDARQFLFWMQQWRDPNAFVDDPIAEYFRTVTPYGFKAIYWLLNLLGLPPFTANKLLPLPLFLITAYYSYRITWTLYPVSAVSIAASWLTCFFLSLIDQSLLSATPRAFAVPLFLWFLFALMQKHPWATAAACALQGLFYPLIALVSAGILSMASFKWKNNRPELALRNTTLLPVLAGLIAIFCALLPYLLNTGGYGPIINSIEASRDPALQEGGRSAFFLNGLIETYLCGARAGFLPVEWGCGEAFRLNLAFAPLLASILLVFAIGTPIVLVFKATAIDVNLDQRVSILLVVVVSSVLGYLAAHFFLFELHLPSRYSQHPLRATSWIAAALLAGPGLIKLGKNFANKSLLQSRSIKVITVTIATAFFILPLPLGPSPYANYVTGKHPQLYAYLRAAPKNISIASLAIEADNIPSFTARSVQGAREYAIPYATGYITPLKQKTKALIRAQYAANLAPLTQYIKHYRPSYILVNRSTFAPNAIKAQWWASDYPSEANWAVDQLHSATPYIIKMFSTCQAFNSAPLILLDANCIAINAAFPS